MANRRPVPSRTRLALVPALSAALALSPALADSGDDTLVQQVRGWARQIATASPSLAQARVEVEVGQLDPRLRLAPCQRVEPYLPASSRPWGRTRVGLRCVEGPSAWNVYLPVTVRLWAPAPVLRTPRPAGHVLTEADFITAETDWAARVDAPLVRIDQLAGRALAQPVGAGQPVRSTQLQRRQWFAAGDTVRIVARGQGYSVSGEGQALTRGLDGETARVRTPAGRVVTGIAVAAQRVELAL